MPRIPYKPGVRAMPKSCRGGNVKVNNLRGGRHLEENIRGKEQEEQIYYSRGKSASRRR